MRQEPLWVFAYGSLIWKPDFDAVEARHGTATGWHRSFCLEMTRWRGSRTQPGLMMALDHGGRCNGVAFRLSDDDRLGQIRRMIRREVGTLDDASSVRWLPIETEQGRVRALVFWAGPKRRSRVAKAAIGRSRGAFLHERAGIWDLRRVFVSDREASGGMGYSRSESLAASEVGSRRTEGHSWPRYGQIRSCA